MTWKLSSGDEWSEETRKYVHTKNRITCEYDGEKKYKLHTWRDRRKKHTTHYFSSNNAPRNESHKLKTENKRPQWTTCIITHSPILILIHNHISYYTPYMYIHYTADWENKICLLCYNFCDCNSLARSLIANARFFSATEFIGRSLFVICKTLKRIDGLSRRVWSGCWLFRVVVGCFFSAYKADSTFNYSLYRLRSEDNCHSCFSIF